MADTPDMIAARNAMECWRSPLDTHPFHGANSVHAEDRAQGALTEASCILVMVTAALFDASALAKQSRTSEFAAMEPKVLATALQGVSRLVDLASFLVEDAR